MALEVEAAFVFGSVKGLFLSVKGLFLGTGVGNGGWGCVDEDTSTLISSVVGVIETADLVAHWQVLH